MVVEINKSLKNITQHIEALIFTAETPITVKDIKECLVDVLGVKINDDEILENINTISEKCRANNFSFELLKIGGGFQFLTKKEYNDTIATLLKQRSQKRLSTAALETLAIISYKQPVTKFEIEQIRGVNCDYTIHRLLEKELVIISGKSKLPGRPLLYATSPSFLDYFGINNIDDLPKLKDIQPETNEIGDEAS